jgi:hypothetical protein
MLWVGLDAYGLTDLVQAGTEHDVVKNVAGLYIARYDAWTEVLPKQPTADPVASSILTLDSGDEIGVEVWVGTASGTPSPNGR